MNVETFSLKSPIVQLAVPSIISNITVPLLGLIDLAIVGHIGDARSISAIAVGSMLFNLVYWVFGFLRMGTSGLTAQALGAGNKQDIATLLRRTVVMGMVVALAIIVFQSPLFNVAMLTISPDTDVVPLVLSYYNICIWGAPAVLVSNGLMGWFIGMQNTRIPMFVAILQNLTNICASLIFVFVLHLRLEGVAMGTLVAQYVGLFVAMALVRVEWRRHGLQSLKSFFEVRNSEERKPSEGIGWLKMIKINRDIFLRTLCLVAVNLYFLSIGARGGALVLAVNSLLMEFYILFSFILDGFAFAGEALGGKFWGAGDRRSFSQTVRSLFLWGFLMTILFTVAFIFFGDRLVLLLTNDAAVRSASVEFASWTWLIPIAGMAAFVWDGLFIGITATRGMLLSAFVSALVFLATDFFLHPLWGNHALWLAFIMFLFMRGLVQTLIYITRLR